ncbi:MAG: hypothetical protein NBV68_03395 [Erythrobacter sp.]|uniref:hypothetical protein n=1 Tax=Erythrobacter sp. TaxID=1042 RepID=UPI0025D115A0|nr:hypothetical protein [Erythrobacter sp.]MCL9998403.1 hypothetical protein [Erythrobacter sp.]
MTAPARRAQTGVRARTRMRGGPLVMLVLLIGGWCGARAMWWHDPLALEPAAAALVSPVPVPVPVRDPVPPYRLAAVDWGAAPIDLARARALLWQQLQGLGEPDPGARAGEGWGQIAPLARARAPAPAFRAEAARLPAFEGSPQWRLVAGDAAVAAPGAAGDGSDPAAPSAPFLPPGLPLPVAAPPGRWSLDAWVFWRQGSSAAPVSQGRVPVYGASQAGAVLQYRLAPSSGHDPRLYARAYRALVTRGENEAALGASLRLFARLPVRVAGEVRYTDAAFFNTFRPAAYAVTEVPPLRLPFGAQGEVYVQGGWVGGPGATPFADAQASVTRSVPLIARLTDERLRLSLGAGAWGGAQKDAQRADIGPTLRLDTRIGKVPARIAVDWRLRVAGDAAPGSGVAVTVSAGF